MLSSDYSAYVLSNIDLVRSLIIKQNQSAEHLNRYLASLGDTISDSPYDWKYYKNLAGQRYLGTELTKNKVITMNSVDTGAFIALNPSVLTQHPKTLNELVNKTNTYKKLLKKFPNEEFYINGIINPIDLNTLISAKDYTILYYDKTLLDDNEINVIPLLQEWIYRVVSRWEITGFGLTDDLYPASFIGILFTNMVSELINIRLSNCNTPYAHNYHIWNYLSGYYKLDRFKDIINKEQALFLYRNIRYISKNAGSQKTLNLLYDGLVRPIDLTFKEYNLIIDKKGYLEELNDINIPVKPDVFTLKTPFNSQAVEIQGYDIQTVEIMLSTIDNKGDLNVQVKPDEILKIEELSLHTNFTTLPIGVIELSAGISSDTLPFDGLKEKFNHWLYLANNDLILYSYNSEVIVTTANAPLNIGAKRAALLLLAISILKHGGTLGTIPDLYAQEVLLIPTLTDEEIFSVVEEKYRIQTISLATGIDIIWNKLENLKEICPTPPNINNLLAFTNYATTIINVIMQHSLLLGTESSGIGKSQLQDMVRMFYRSELCSLTNFTTFDDFLSDIKVDLTDLPLTTLDDLANEIVTNFIGNYGNSQRQLVNGIMGILDALTSYTIKFTSIPDVTEYANIIWSSPDIEFFFEDEVAPPELDVYLLENRLVFDAIIE